MPPPSAEDATSGTLKDNGPTPIGGNRAAVLLAGIAGYVDTLGFVALFGLFTAHVTGNFVLIGAELIRPGHGVLLKFLAFPAFVLAVAASRVIALWRERRGRPALRPLLAVQAVLLLGFMGAGVMGQPIQGTDAPWPIAAGLLGAAAMGLQNGTGRLLLAKLTPHTVMTGNVTQLVLELTDYLLGHRDAAVRERMSKLGWPIAAFGAGAILGALGYVQFGFIALLPAVAAVVFLARRGIAV